jgi:hypothetical protein
MNAQTVARFAQGNPETARAGQDQVRAVLSRSATDKAFRQLLLSDPRAAIAEATGQAVPANFRVAFVENTADATVVLPPVVSETAELSDSELEAVAGGTEPIAIGLAIFAGSMMLGIAIAKATN